MTAVCRYTLQCNGCSAELVTREMSATTARRVARQVGWRFGAKRVTASGPALSVDLCEQCAGSPPADVQLVDL